MPSLAAVVTVRVAFFETPAGSVAVITADEVAGIDPFVFTVKLALLPPAGTVTLPDTGTDATVPSELDRLIVTPPAPAAASNFTRPVAVDPFTTREGVSVSPDNTLPGVTVTTAVLTTTPPTKALTVIDRARGRLVAACTLKVPSDAPIGIVSAAGVTVATVASEVASVTDSAVPVPPFNATVPVAAAPTESTPGVTVNRSTAATDVKTTGADIALPA